MSAPDVSDSPCWELVPTNALQIILQNMDVPARLGVASLVCKRWAAVARRCDIQLAGLQDPDRMDGVLEYLGQYGDGISRLDLAATQMDEPQDFLELRALPQCSNLRDLGLTNFRLLPAAEQDSEGAAAGVLSATTGLTRFSLANVFLTCGEPDLGLEEPDLSPGALSVAAEAAAAAVAASFRPIQRLTELQELSLRHVLTISEVPTQYLYIYQCDFAVLDIPGDGLATLTRLSKLELVGAAADPCATLQHISRLTGLRDLQLAQLPPQDPESDSNQPHEVAAAAAATFAGLGQLQQLTSLSVNTVQGTLSRQCLGGGQGRRTPHSMLTTLLRLQLGHVKFEPALLAGMTQLTFLLLSDVTWVVSPADLRPSTASGSQAPPAQGLAAYKLLQLLPSLQQLRWLMLDIQTSDWPTAEEQLPAYTALTANPRLEHIDLQLSKEYPLPAPAWKHIFRTGLQLPAIAGLAIRGICPQSCRRRVLGCCPAVEAGLDAGRSPCPFNDAMLKLRVPDPEEDGVTLAQLRLLEIGDEFEDAEGGKPPGVPAVLGALTHLEVLFKGGFHGWGVHGCSEDELCKGKFLQQRRFKRKFRIR